MRTIGSVLLCFASLIAARSAVAASRTINLTLDGVAREALVFEPPNVAQGKHAVVFAFHGHGGNMRSFAHTAEFETHWPQAVVVYPQGLPTPSKLDPEGREAGWQRQPGEQGDRDLKFVDALLKQIEHDDSIEPKRIYATGFSNGGVFTLLLWQTRADTFAAFAAAAGVLEPSQELTAARPVLQIAGEHDGLVSLARQQAMVEQERKADGAGAPGVDCGPGCTLYRGTAPVKFLLHGGKHEYPATIAQQTIEFFRTASNAGNAADGDVAKTAATAGPKADIVQYKSNGQDLMAFVYKPPGAGPFPVYMWNHGVERDPGPGALLARFFVPRGYIFFAPLRSGHGPNKGAWILDEQKAVTEPRSPQGFKKLMALYERANEDTLAAYNWIARQSYVDPKRIVVAGGGQGAVQALLLAERDRTEVLNIRCVVAIAPAAESWANPHWAKRLETAVATARAPIFLLQANNDFSLGPSETLGPRIDARGGANRHKVYPAHGAAEDHVAGHAGFSGASNEWGEDLVDFLHACGASSGP